MTKGLKITEKDKKSGRKAGKGFKDAEGKIIQLEKMASMGQFVSSIAHEINSPLAGVLNNVQLLRLYLKEKDKLSVTDFQEILGVIEEAASRCMRIIQDLLDFSRAGKRPYQVVNVNGIVEKTIILAGYEMRLKGVGIVKELSRSLLLVNADPHQLQQVFLDILANAKWAVRSKEGAQIWVKTIASQDNKSVIMEISDNGCGIEKENLKHIFEPFFTTKKAEHGIGLGLAICEGIIKKHRGSIEVESEGEGKGALFRVILPIVK